MNDTYFILNENIKKEANEILNEKGLFSILAAYGKVNISGSYSLDLMTWKDLDIYLEAENITKKKFFKLGA